MIDFRYHVVSLVSVFLALAVGIVLGAGPLKESIGNTLTDQVASLRKDRDLQGADLKRAEASLAHRDALITALGPSLVANQLGGRNVVVVTLPDADDDDLKVLDSNLKAAGATITGRVGVTEAWTDPEGIDARAQLTARLQSNLAQADQPAGADLLAALLTRALVTDEIAKERESDAVATALVKELKDADLITVDGDLDGRATLAVIVGPAVPVASAATPSPSPPPADETLGAWKDLVAQLDARSDGAVVLGPASSAAKGGLIAAIRSDSDVARQVSTVDTAGSPMGPIIAVLALSEQLRGSAGAYGFGPGAKAPLPQMPEEAQS